MSQFEIIPAIDLKDGQCVRLVQGRKDQVTVYGTDPEAVAKQFEQAGAKRIHVVDLDGAFDGRPRNMDHLIKIVKAVNVPVQTGGGIRNLETVSALLDAGVDRVIFGTSAIKQPQLVEEACAKYGPNRILVGIDARNGKVAVEGWVEESTLEAFDLALQMKEIGIEQIVYTDIARDGMLTGPNFHELQHMLNTGMKIVASGGVATMGDLKKIAAFKDRGVTGAIVGKAIYTGDVDLADAVATIEGPI